MRILHVVNDADTGGAQTLIEALAQRRGPQDQVHILVLLGRGGLSDRLEAAATTVDYVGMSRKEVLPARASVHLLRLVRKHKIDVVHSHLHQSDLVNAITPHGRPRISTQHASEDASSSKVAHAAWKAAGKMSFRMDQMVACSPSARNITAEFGYTFPPEKMPVIFNGTTVTQAPSPNPGGQLLLHLARFAPPKDHRNLLETMARVHAQHPQARLLCAGNGVDEANTQLRTWRTELGLDGVVEFAGTITNVREKLRQAAALIFASYNEALPMAGLEAISEGLPVITTRAGDAAFMTVDEHLAVPPRDPDALAAAVDWFLTRTPEQVDDLRQASWELSHRDFDINRATERYMAIYRDLAHS